jgi:Uma2 family endonuclease
LAANFTGSDVYGEDGILFGVVLETRGSKPCLGFLLGDLEASLLYADALGGAVIAGDDATLVEISEDGSVVRAWSWISERANPPAVAVNLPSIEDFRGSSLVY